MSLSLQPWRPTGTRLRRDKARFGFHRLGVIGCRETAQDRQLLLRDQQRGREHDTYPLALVSGAGGLPSITSTWLHAADQEQNNMLIPNDRRNRIRFFTKYDATAAVIRRTMKMHQELASTFFTLYADVRSDNLDLLLTGIDAVVLHQPKFKNGRGYKYQHRPFGKPASPNRLILAAARARNIAVATIVLRPSFDVAVGSAGRIHDDDDLFFLTDALACGAGRDDFVDVPDDEDLFDSIPLTEAENFTCNALRDLTDPILPEYQIGGEG
jgi:hypothetical protein